MAAGRLLAGECGERALAERYAISRSGPVAAVPPLPGRCGGVGLRDLAAITRESPDLPLTARLCCSIVLVRMEGIAGGSLPKADALGLWMARSRAAIAYRCGRALQLLVLVREVRHAWQ